MIYLRYQFVRVSILPGMFYHIIFCSTCYCFKNATILSLSLSVSKARLCMCIPIVSHFSGEKVDGEGILWHRWQFSAHNWAPDFDCTFWLAAQLFNTAIITIIDETSKIKRDNFFLNKKYIFIVLKLNGKLQVHRVRLRNSTVHAAEFCAYPIGSIDCFVSVSYHSTPVQPIIKTEGEGIIFRSE